MSHQRAIVDQRFSKVIIVANRNGADRVIINRILNDGRMGMYRLSELSGVPQSTIADICSEKSSITRGTAGTLHKIAKILNAPLINFQDEYPGILEMFLLVLKEKRRKGKTNLKISHRFRQEVKIEEVFYCNCNRSTN